MHRLPTTLPVILPQVVGWLTFMLTSTGASEYGVSVARVSLPVYVPGWVAVEESIETTTVAAERRTRSFGDHAAGMPCGREGSHPSRWGA